MKNGPLSALTKKSGFPFGFLFDRPSHLLGEFLGKRLILDVGVGIALGIGAVVVDLSLGIIHQVDDLLPYLRLLGSQLGQHLRFA